MNENRWYQVRIFVKTDDSHQNFEWSLNVIGDIVKEFVEEYPKVQFWFTKYFCPLTIDGVDSERIPTKYLYEKNWTKSLRFRFKPTHKKHIKRLKELLKQHEAHYWSTGIKSYNHMDDLGGNRFIHTGYLRPVSKAERKRRGNLVQRALEYNCRLILDCLSHHENKWVLEENENENNVSFGNISRSMTHLYVNPWVTSKGSALPIYGIDWSAIFGI